MSASAVLHTLLDSILATAQTGSATLSGMEVMSRADVSAHIAVDPSGTIHFLLTPSAERPERFERFRLRALEIANAEWVVAARPAATYLDVRCLAGARSAMRRPFLAFCDDVLVELNRVPCSPEDAVFRTCMRWQRFWTSDEDESFSVEWLRGLLGELLFVEYLVDRVGPACILSWVGPTGRDHDFQSGTQVAFEVKTSAIVPFTVECNLNQLDDSLFSKLFLTCFLAVRSDEGEAITDVITRVETKLGGDERAVDAFFERLHRAGYRRHLQNEYERLRFTVTGPTVFPVSADFPRITVGSFAKPLDARIRGVRYQLQVAGVESLPSDSHILAEAIQVLAAVASDSDA
jgi:hypothetical protein